MTILGLSISGRFLLLVLVLGAVRAGAEDSPYYAKYKYGSSAAEIDFGPVISAVPNAVVAEVIRRDRILREGLGRNTLRYHPLDKGPDAVALMLDGKLAATLQSDLGFAPLRPESFALGVQAGPHYIAADSGSDDVGPVPVGSDTSTSPQAWQRQDLEHMLLASRRLGVPMVIGSAGDTGSNSRVDLYVQMIRELAAEHRLAPFKLGYFYSEVPRERVRRAIRAGSRVAGLDGYEDLTEAELDATDRIVAMAGVHPYMALLRQGADVIIGGRSSDAAVFAAPALHHGYHADQAYYLGKVLECASFCAEPYGGKETVLGMVSHEDFKVTAMHPPQRCTVASVAGHAMYERSNPYEEFFAGGRLDMTHCRYEQFDERTTRITGSRFIPDQKVRVKLEGSGKVGERYVGLCGIRDPYTIANVDKVIDWARAQVRERFGDSGYQLHYNVYIVAFSTKNAENRSIRIMIAKPVSTFLCRSFHEIDRGYWFRFNGKLIPLPDLFCRKNFHCYKVGKENWEKE